jgi:hypothetical protein
LFACVLYQCFYFFVSRFENRITSFALTAPPGVRKSSIQSVPGRPNVYKIVVTWVPKQENKGQHALCVEATDSFAYVYLRLANKITNVS